jgi:MFS family permease
VLNFGFVAGLGLSLLVGGLVIRYLGGLPPVELPLVGELRDWQLTFVAVGVPGLIVASLLATVPEPQRRGLARIAAATSAQVKPKSIPLREVGRFLLDNRRAYAPMFLGVAVNTVLAFGHQAWYAAFFARTYGWSAPQFAFAFGFIIVVGAPIMLILGSRLAEWYASKGYHDANMRVTLIASILVMPGAIAFAFMPTPQLAVGVISFNFCVAMLSPGPQNAALQIITPNQMRGQVTALFLFVFNIIGFGLGATIVASITNYVIGDESQLRYSLALTSAILGPLAVLIFWWGLKPYARAVERAEQRYAAEAVPAGE